MKDCEFNKLIILKFINFRINYKDKIVFMKNI